MNLNSFYPEHPRVLQVVIDTTGKSCLLLEIKHGDENMYIPIHACTVQ